MPKKTRSITTAKSSPTFAGIQRDASPSFNPDYTHIKADLKRIGTLAGSFFAILVVLAFIMPLISR